MEQWKATGKLPAADREDPEKYFKLFEEYISPKSNALLAVMELKRLFQGNMSLEDFHSKAIRLIKEADYPANMRDRVLRDTLISGISCDTSRAKIIKKGKDVKLEDVLETCRMETAIRQQMASIGETSNISYLKYGNNKKNPKPKPKAGGTGTVPQASKCFRCGKGAHQKGQKCPAIDATCRHCGKKGHYEVICMSKQKGGNSGNYGKSSTGHQSAYTMWKFKAKAKVKVKWLNPT